jgi:hypothetical protein
MSSEFELHTISLLSIHFQLDHVLKILGDKSGWETTQGVAATVLCPGYVRVRKNRTDRRR